MRSSRSVPDLLDPGPKGFAHRGLHAVGIPENSLSAFAAAVEFGAGIECDLRLTADDRILVFHDADASRMCGINQRVGQSTLQELASLRVGGDPIPTLSALLELVGGRVPLLLEVKTEGDARRWPRALAHDLAGYRGAFGVMSFSPWLGRLLKSKADFLRGLVVRSTLPPFRRRLAIQLAAPDFLAIDRAALDQPWVERMRQSVPVYSWTIRTPARRAQAEVQADALIWEADGRPRI